MSDIAIHVENLSKMYHIGRARERRDTLRDALGAAARAPLGWLQRDGRGGTASEDTIWALKDVSFEVQRGEVLGIIGRNGAGKSTLLKILTRITEPTEGRAEIHGRVGSLLEVGTGFHPELTGRENVYLSGAILGMRKTEIDRKFDEIVAFSGVEKLIDTPVKRYSSGMHVRLGFSVAAHLEPEILLIDEVLAVGDAAFQKKCLGKMGDVAGKGRTVLFVSHNMSAVISLCQRCILLSSGCIARAGKCRSVIEDYVSREASVLRGGEAGPRRTGTGQAEILDVQVADSAGQVGLIRIGRPFEVRIGLRIHQELPDAAVGFAIMSPDRTEVMTSWNTDSGAIERGLAAGGTWRCRVEHNVLKPGTYGLRAAVFKPRAGDFLQYDWVDPAATFEVVIDGGDAGRLWDISRAGQVLAFGDWAFEPDPA